MADMDINSVLAQMRVIGAGARGGVEPTAAPATAEVSFSKLLSQSIEMVNENQAGAREMKTAYQTGAANVELPEVMIAVQKASISFEAMSQVRNKLLSAYQEIMNMPV